jgi:type III restriction enzyme
LQLYRTERTTGSAPGVGNLARYGRWAFAEFTAVYEIEREFGRLIDGLLMREAA